MLKNTCLLAKIGADAAENERDFAEILPKIGNYPPGPLPILGTRGGRRARRGEGRLREGLERCPLLLAPQQNLASLPTLHVDLERSSRREVGIYFSTCIYLQIRYLNKGKIFRDSLTKYMKEY